MQAAVAAAPNGAHISLASASDLAASGGLTPTAHPGAALQTACLQGIMKAAASELGTLKVLSTHLADPTHQRLHLATQQQPQQGDVHGLQQSAGLLSQPHLLCYEATQSVDQQMESGYAPGDWTMSGGSGALGSLVAVFLANRLPHESGIHLLSRAGRTCNSTLIQQVGHVRICTGTPCCSTCCCMCRLV